jgi:cytochrome P450
VSSWRFSVTPSKSSRSPTGEPADDFASDLVVAADGASETMTEGWLGGQTMGLIYAGDESTSSLITRADYALLLQPIQWKQRRANSSLLVGRSKRLFATMDPCTPKDVDVTGAYPFVVLGSVMTRRDSPSRTSSTSNETDRPRSSRMRALAPLARICESRHTSPPVSRKGLCAP